jgi:hypothetical protein
MNLMNIQSLWANEIIWCVVNTLIRVSASMSLCRIFSYWCEIYLLLVFVSVLYCIIVVLVSFLICRPLLAAWNPYVNGVCGNEVMVYTVLEALGLVIDITIIIAPVYRIWCVTSSLRAKLGPMILFSLGAL